LFFVQGEEKRGSRLLTWGKEILTGGGGGKKEKVMSPVGGEEGGIENLNTKVGGGRKYSAKGTIQTVNPSQDSYFAEYDSKREREGKKLTSSKRKNISQSALTKKNSRTLHNSQSNNYRVKKMRQ